MSLFVEAGMEGWARELLTSRDPVFVQTGQAVAERVLARRQKNSAARDKALGNAIGKMPKAIAGEIGRVLQKLLGG